MIAAGKTFLYHDGALGDVLLSLPCLIAIKRDSAFLHVSCREDVGRLLQAAGIADEVSPSGGSRYASLFTGNADDSIGELLSRFDQAFVFTITGDSGFLRAIESILPGTRVIITLPPKGTIVHISAFRAGQWSGARDSLCHPLLPVPLPYQEPARIMLSRAGYERGRPLIAMHPGSGSTDKCWPLDRYFAVATQAAKTFDAVTLFLTGPAESDDVKERVDAFARSAGCIHVVDRELAAVAALLSQCNLYIGNDSGVGHLAAAAGCPVIALFGPTNPDVWRPVGPNVRVIRSARLDEIAVEEVLGEMKGVMEQS